MWRRRSVLCWNLGGLPWNLDLRSNWGHDEMKCQIDRDYLENPLISSIGPNTEPNKISEPKNPVYRKGEPVWLINGRKNKSNYRIQQTHERQFITRLHENQIISNNTGWKLSVFVSDKLVYRRKLNLKWTTVCIRNIKKASWCHAKKYHSSIKDSFAYFYIWHND